MILFRDADGFTNFGPDYVYMNYKIDVLGNAYKDEVLNEVVNLRSLSYCM